MTPTATAAPCGSTGAASACRLLRRPSCLSPEPEAAVEETTSAADRYDDAEGLRLPLWEIGVAAVLVLLAALAGGFWAARRGSWRR